MKNGYLNGDLFQKGDNYIIIGNIGICWGEVNPKYANGNVLLGTVSLPITFKNAKAQATCRIYNNGLYELDSIPKVNVVNGNSVQIALHSNSSKYTSTSGDFWVNYLVIGTIS